MSRWVIVFVILGGFLRVWPLAHGLPHLSLPDEGMVVRRALAFSTGDLNPHSFHWPAFHLYVVFLFEGALVAAGLLLGFFASIEDARAAFFVDPTPFFVAARVPSALMGTATIAFTAAIAREIAGRSAGAIAAAVMAIVPIAVRDAHMAITDVPSAFWTSVTIWLALRAMRGAGSWVLAGIAAGLATATKYNAAAAALAPLWAAATLSPRLRIRVFLLVGASAALAFVIATPYNVLDFDTFLRDLRFQRAHLAEGHYGVAVNPIIYYADKLVWAQIVNTAVRIFDPLPFVLLIGIAAAIPYLRSWPARLTLAPPLVALAIMATWGMAATRYWNPLFPPLVAVAAVGLSRLRITFRGPLLASLVVTAGVAVAGNVSMTQRDTRIEALDWIEANVPRDSTIAADRYVPTPPESRAALMRRAIDPPPHPTQTAARMRRVYAWMAAAAPKHGWRTIRLGVGPESEAENRLDFSFLDVAELRSHDARAIAITSWGQDRLRRAANDRERHMIESFDRELRRDATLAAEFHPTGLQPGPSVWIYRLGAP